MSDRKVSIIDPLGGHGGMDYYNLELAKSLRRQGVDVKVFTCNETQVNDSYRDWVDITYNNIFGNSPPIIRGLNYLYGTVHSLFKSLFQRRSLVHFHLFTFDYLRLFDIVIAKLLFLKVIITVHDIESLTINKNSEFIKSIVFLLSSKVIVHNEYSHCAMLKILPKRSDDIFRVEHGNYVAYVRRDVDRYESRRHLKLPTDIPVILFFGNIKESKGLDVLLKAIKELRLNTELKFKLVIAGRPAITGFNEYQRLIDELEISDNVILRLGFVSQDDAFHYYNMASAVVLPYRLIYQSGVLLMAMSHSRCAVVSDIPPMLETVTHNNDGLVFKVDDPSSLAIELNVVVSEQSTIELLEKQSLETALDRYSWDKVAHKTKLVYRC